MPLGDEACELLGEAQREGLGQIEVSLLVSELPREASRGDPSRALLQHESSHAGSRQAGYPSAVRLLIDRDRWFVDPQRHVDLHNRDVLVATAHTGGGRGAPEIRPGELAMAGTLGVLDGAAIVAGGGAGEEAQDDGGKQARSAAVRREARPACCGSPSGSASACPLNIQGGTGSPPNVLVIK